MGTLDSADFDRWFSAEDGPLPDGTIASVTPAAWQRFFDLIAARHWFLWWGDPGGSQMPSVSDALREGVASTLALSVGAGVQINVFPGPDPAIYFDFDRRQIVGTAQAEALSAFIRSAGQAASRPVRLSFEGQPARIFAVYEPASDSFRT